MSGSSSRMDFPKLIGAGTGIYDAWIALLQQANAKNSDVYYMNFPVFPQFIILYENRIHLCEFLKECEKLFGGNPGLMNAIEKCEEVRRLVFEDAEYGFHRVGGKPEYQAMTNNERRKLLIGILEKCRIIDQEIVMILQNVCEVL